MTKKYGTFRPIKAAKPPKLSNQELRRVIAAIQHGKKGKQPPPETGISFFLAALPRKPNTEYKILADGVIEADKIIMA